MKAKYLITSALPYANGPIHIGHLAGAYLPADIYTKYLRMSGHDVAHVSGSDQYGAAIGLRAKKEGVPAAQIADYYHNHIHDTFKKFGIDFDLYSKTANSIHKKNASDFFEVLYKKNVLEKKKALQYYDPQANEFLADRYIAGNCPYCNFDKAYGDQCERCGASLTPDLLINPRSTISNSELILKESEHWYFPVNLYQNFLKEWVDTKKKIFKTTVYGQCQSWLNQGLTTRAITRDLSWGIPVPIDGYENKVLYVWFEAPIGYISATNELMILQNKSLDHYWKDETTKLVHFIGKDNIVFHCLIFPAMLKAHGDYILPAQISANEFLNLEGEKISTSRNWAVWLHEYIEAFPNQQDVLRYVLCSIMPENKDADFSWKDFQAKNNNELIAILGNYVNRCVVLLGKIFDWRIPSKNEMLPEDVEFIASIHRICEQVGECLEAFKFREALALCMNVARLGNKYLTDQEPWKIYKKDLSRTKTILNLSFQVVYKLRILFYPFLPNFALTLAKLFSANDNPFRWENLFVEDMVQENTKISEIGLLFKKIEDSEIEKEIKKLTKNKTQ